MREAGERFGAGRRRSPSACSVEFVSRQPDRADHGGLRAPRRLRRLALPDPRAGRQRGRARVLRQRPRHPGARCSASRSARAPAARSRPRTATRATTSPSWPSGSTARPTAIPDELARRGIELMLEGVARDARALPRAHGPLLLRALAARAGAVRPRRSSGLDGVYEHEGARLAAHHRRSATTRTACCAAHRRAHLLRHRHRLPRGQARARLRPRRSTCWAPTTTATAAACARPGRRSAATRTASRS